MSVLTNLTLFTALRTLTLVVLLLSREAFLEPAHCCVESRVNIRTKLIVNSCGLAARHRFVVAAT